MKSTYADALWAPNGTTVGRTRTLEKALRSGLEYAGESLAYRTLSLYLESLMVDGRIGNKLALLALKQLSTSESLIKVDMMWGDC